MSDWLLSGKLIDLIIALTVVEAGLLAGFHRLTQRGLAPQDYLLNLVSGLCLMLALRCALAGAGWHWIAAALSAAGLAHASDLVSRWKRRQRTSDFR